MPAIPPSLPPCRGDHGAASGIGLPPHVACLDGTEGCLADLSAEALERLRRGGGRRAAGRAAVIASQRCHKLESVQALKDKAYAAFGEVAVLMKTPAPAPGGGPGHTSAGSACSAICGA